MTDKDPNLVKTPINTPHTKSSDSVASNTVASNINDVAEETVVHKGTETLEAEYGNTEHVKTGDNPARQPDPRDQQGEWFDGGVNADNPRVKSDMDDTPQSEEINEYNRYANLDNAQTRVLNTHDKKSAD